MTKFKSLFYLGFSIIVLPIIVILFVLILSLISIKTNEVKTENKLVYDTIQVKQQIIIYDTIKIVNHSVKKKIKIDSVRVEKDTIN